MLSGVEDFFVSTFLTEEFDPCTCFRNPLHSSELRILQPIV